MYLTIVKMDRQGRILIPADIRAKLQSTVFALELDEGELRLKPLRRAKLSEFFDSIEVDVDDFTDTHKLRKALLEGGSP
ncbi:MAG: AbrB/MazE/SpoVT family DNA-binding domain-containing protein [Candidatus Verstraetearchaeota archaeon]|nr:AbrB/MazE/SpoVT family DNA-binding domain-containing protein [Candidatus Verstraetearchaeota archaeon]